MKEFYLSDSVEATEKIAAEFAKKLNMGNFVAMYGDLGVGKTAFVRGMAQTLTPSADVHSPTYAIVNEYYGANTRLCHFDMYRIQNEDDLYSIGFYDYTDCIIVAEWCEKIPFALPDSYYRVEILKKEANNRQISIELVEREI